MLEREKQSFTFLQFQFVLQGNSLSTDKICCHGLRQHLLIGRESQGLRIVSSVHDDNDRFALITPFVNIYSVADGEMLHSAFADDIVSFPPVQEFAEIIESLILQSGSAFTGKTVCFVARPSAREITPEHTVAFRLIGGHEYFCSVIDLRNTAGSQQVGNSLFETGQIPGVLFFLVETRSVVIVEENKKVHRVGKHEILCMIIVETIQPIGPIGFSSLEININDCQY